MFTGNSDMLPSPPAVRGTLLDFEKAAWLAIRSVFGVRVRRLKSILVADFPAVWVLRPPYGRMEFLSPAGAVGPGTGDIATPPVRLSVRLSVHHV